MPNEIDKSVKATTKALAKLRTSAVPQAVRFTVNQLAYNATFKAIANAEKRFVLRNAYTRRNYRYDKATQRNIGDMVAYVGHKEEYIKKQEQGGVQDTGGGDHNWVALPGARTSGSFAKPPRRAFYKDRIETVRRTGSTRRSRKSHSVAQFFVAKRTGKYIIRERGDKKTLLQVRTVRRIRGGGIRALLVALYQLQEPKRLRKRPTIQPAIEKTVTPVNVARTFEKQAVRILSK